MFFGTPHHLLRPIHSLLKAPFKFEAVNSIGVNLREKLHARPDFEDLLALGLLFDEANIALKSFLPSLRQLLQDKLSHVILLDADHSPVCCTNFKGLTPQVLGFDGARYLSHVSVQCQIERLYDQFHLQRSGEMNPLGSPRCADAIKLLMLSEAIALSIADVAKVERNGGGFNLTVSNPTALNTLRNTWFARLADQSSHAGTIALAGQLARNGADSLQDVEALTERILEQDLSIPWHRMSAIGRSLKSVDRIYAAAGVVALLTVLGLRGKSLRMFGPDLKRHGLDFSAVAALIGKQTDALVTDQFITRRNDLLNVRIEGAAKGLRQIFRSWATEFGERDVLRVHVGGFFYERTYIRERIEYGDDYKTRYRVFDGFDRYKIIGGAPNECDVEFIIKDFQQGHYYFIQAKHALLGEKAFLEAVVEAIQKDIGKGLHQLREAKRLFDNGVLSETLKARGITDAMPSNSSFVLLHNIAQLDFQSSTDGISLYDWASFRNLLKDGECRYSHSNGQAELVRLPTPLIVANPTDVIQRLLSEHPAYRKSFSDPWAQERVTTSYEVMGKMIRVRGLGI